MKMLGGGGRGWCSVGRGAGHYIVRNIPNIPVPASGDTLVILAAVAHIIHGDQSPDIVQGVPSICNVLKSSMIIYYLHDMPKQGIKVFELNTASACNDGNNSVEYI